MKEKNGYMDCDKVLFEQARDIILIVGLDGRIIDANQTAVSTYGYTKSELVAMTAFELRGHKDSHLTNLQMDMASVDGILFETVHYRKDGRPIPVEVSSVGTILEGKQVLLSIIRDISERKKAERAQIRYQQALHEAKERFQVTLRSIGDAVIATDVSARITLMNAVAEELTGWQSDEALGLHLDTVFRIISEENRRPVKSPVEKVLASGRIVGLANHTALLSRDGTERPIADSAAPIVTADGRIEGVVLVFRDVTQERRAQNLLKASEERYRTTFENTGTAMAVIEADTIISHVNRQMEILSGYRKQDIEGKMSILDLVVAEDQPRMRKYHNNRRIAQAAPRVYEFDFVDKHHSIKHALCTVEMIPGTSQSVASILDITERKRAEQRAKFLNFHDSLTGLYNRVYFEHLLTSLDDEVFLPYTIIIGDVNGLKLVNDAFGHTAGDRLLQQIARVLVESCKEEDTVARWGGDEFIMMCPRCSEADAEALVTRIKQACSATATDLPIQLSISLGYATKQNTTSSNRKVIQTAEDRMYQNKLMETTSFRNSIISSLEGSLRERDYETEEHAQRLKQLCLRVGRAIGLSESQLNELALLAALHDIGKLAIPDSVLMKPGPLDDAEWEVMKRHSEIGYRIASSSPDLIPISEAILAHHERWDGKGYPRGLSREGIPLISRILAIVDSYDVMTHERPYKRAMTTEDALAEVRRCSGSQFDPGLVDVFLRLFAVHRVDLNNVSGTDSPLNC